MKRIKQKPRREKADKHNLPQRPEGCYTQKAPRPSFFPHNPSIEHRPSLPQTPASVKHSAARFDRFPVGSFRVCGTHQPTSQW
jgi:hypothetical protein